MKQYRLVGLMIVLGTLLLAGPAIAQDYDPPEPEDSTIRSSEIIEESEFETNRDYMDPTIEPVAIDDPYLAPDPLVTPSGSDTITRSEERRVGKECRCRWARYH